MVKRRKIFIANMEQSKRKLEKGFADVLLLMMFGGAVLAGSFVWLTHYYDKKIDEVSRAVKPLGATVLSTDLSDTINTFRTNVNTSLTNINNQITSTTSTDPGHFHSLTVSVTGTLPIESGGTETTSLTANNVILGNGTSSVQFVAPGSLGNRLTSDGTTWIASSSLTLNSTSTFQATVDFTASSTLSGNINRILNATNTDVDTRNTAVEQTVLSYSVPANTLDTDNIIEVHIPLDVFGCLNSSTSSVRLAYGGTNISTSTIACPSSSSPNDFQGWINAYLIANASTTSQYGWLEVNFIGNTTPSATALNPFVVNTEGTSAVNSTAAQTLSVLAENPVANSSFGFLTMGHVIKLWAR